MVSEPESSPEAKREGSSLTARHGGSAERRTSRGCSGRRGAHRTELERPPEARSGGGTENWTREARERENRRGGHGGSNGGEMEGIGVLVGVGRQLKGSVDGGGYRQPKKAKRRGECGGEWEAERGGRRSARELDRRKKKDPTRLAHAAEGGAGADRWGRAGRERKRRAGEKKTRRQVDPRCQRDRGERGRNEGRVGRNRSWQPNKNFNPFSFI